MTNTALRTGAALLCFASLTACQRVQMFCLLPAQISLPKVAQSNPYPIPVRDDCRHSKKKIDVVHITIFNVDEAKFDNSAVVHFKSDPRGLVSEGRALTAKAMLIDGHRTWADFNAGGYLAAQGDLVLIELELQDATGVTFPEGTNSAVFTSDATNGDMFCVKEAMHVGPNQKIVRFYTRWVEKANGQPKIGAYTFAYAIPGTGEKRLVVLDPDVKNEG